MSWETVIGLEVHIQLATKSKIFSSESTEFGAQPNMQASLIDLAMPGTLPVVNEQAMTMAAKFALAIGAEVGKTSVFERKNYFYPDLPKGYQTTQLEKPIVGAGGVNIKIGDSTKFIRIHHAHLEEDAGKSIHDAVAGFTGVDLNRAGVPLLEIVSEPDMANAQEAIAYLKVIHSIVTYLGISDGNMAEGSMRCDANVSVRKKGEPLGTRAEIKNINSFRFVEKAIEYEADRQIDVLESGGKLVQETRLYDSEKNTTRSMRSKEDANDYRYFPCPDLLPVVLSDEFIADLKSQMPELADKKRARFIQDYDLTEYDSELLTQDKRIADFFEDCLNLGATPKLVANWLNGEIAAHLNKQNLDFSQLNLTAQQLVDLLARIEDATINGGGAKQVLATILEGSDKSVDEIIADAGLKQMSDSGEIQTMVESVVENNPKQLEAYLSAPEEKRAKMLGFFVGQIMKQTGGKANPQIINKLLLAELAKRA